MKKNVIIFVVLLITLSLLGLIGIQLYWISNAFILKESNFNRDVSEALTSAIYKYNKIEMAGIFFQEYEEDEQLNLFFNKLDSINHAHYEKIAEEIDSAAEPSDTLSSYHEPYGFPNLDPFTGAPIDENDDKPSFFEYQQGGYADRKRGPGNSDNLYWDFFQRSKIINDLFDELFSAQQNIKPALQQNISILDSLIQAEMERSGIRTKYEFGVYDPVYNTLISEKTGNYSEDLLQTEYAFSLFPNDVFRSPEFLLIYFPNQQTYLLTQMNIMTMVSGIFILVIISSFTYTIITIIKQKQLSLMKNDFINNMTHELKTPISTISLACQALRDKDVQKSENLYQNYINVINEENERLGLMTQRVLQTAQLEKGKLHLNKTGFNLHDVIEDAIRKIDLQLGSRHGKIEKHLNAEFSFLEADKVHTTNVIFNLLDNAIKYSDNFPKIIIFTENVNNGILIHVEDYGIGISKINQKKIFDNLYRISTGNVHNVKGFGLGLSYVKAIAELHGGYVKLQSELKKGSRFSVFIPFGFD